MSSELTQPIPPQDKQRIKKTRHLKALWLGKYFITFLSGAVIVPLYEHYFEELIFPTPPALDVSIPNVAYRGSTVAFSVFRENTLNFDGLECQLRILVGQKELQGTKTSIENCGNMQIRMPYNPSIEWDERYGTEGTAEVTVDWGRGDPIVWLQPFFISSEFKVRIQSDTSSISVAAPSSIEAKIDGDSDSVRCVWSVDESDGIRFTSSAQTSCSGRISLVPGGRAHKESLQEGQVKTSVRVELYDLDNTPVGSESADMLVIP